MLTRVQFQDVLVCRRILYFPCVELNTTIPHYFICFSTHPINHLNFSCCTSQFDTVKRLIERHRFPPQTLVYIPHTDVNNPFKKDTYINCNEWWPFSIEELWNIYCSGQMEILEDLLPLESFEQMLIGLATSNQIEEELKDSLPNIDDF